MDARGSESTAAPNHCPQMTLIALIRTDRAGEKPCGTAALGCVIAQFSPQRARALRLVFIPSILR